MTVTAVHGRNEHSAAAAIAISRLPNMLSEPMRIRIMKKHRNAVSAFSTGVSQYSFLM